MTTDQRERLEFYVSEDSPGIQILDDDAIKAALAEIDRLTTERDALAAKLATYTAISVHVDYFAHLRCLTCGAPLDAHDPITCPITSRAMVRTGFLRVEGGHPCD